MKIVVFGATGSIGSQVVKQALDQGHHVTAFTRSPEKLSSKNHQSLQVLEGDVLNLVHVEKAIQQKDAIICALGDGNKGIVRAAGTLNIITAMKKAGITKMICQTTLGLGESHGNLNFLWKHIMFGLLLKKAFNDHALQERHVLASDLDYTIVRPSAFTDGSVTRNYKIGFDGSYKNLNLKIARADVADFMLQQLHSTKFIRKTVSIST